MGSSFWGCQYQARLIRRRAKTLLQDIWRSGGDWDDTSLPTLLTIWAASGTTSIAVINKILCCSGYKKNPSCLNLNFISTHPRLFWSVCLHVSTISELPLSPQSSSRKSKSRPFTPAFYSTFGATRCSAWRSAV